MFLLTKLDKTRVLLTLETIKYIEETPDTLVRFLNGESIIVRESIDQITRLIVSMKQGDAHPYEVESSPSRAAQHLDQ